MLLATSFEHDAHMADLPGAALVYYGADLRIAVGRPGETAALPRQGPLVPGIDLDLGDSTALSSARDRLLPPLPCNCRGPFPAPDTEGSDRNTTAVQDN